MTSEREEECRSEYDSDDSKNAKAAAEKYRRAAEQGDAYAQVYLGRMLANGYGVKKDAKAAAEQYRRAAEQGHADALLQRVRLQCKKTQAQGCVARVCKI